MTKFGKNMMIAGVIIVLGVVVFLLQKTTPTVVAPEDNTDLVQEFEMLGNKYDLLQFSILPGTTVPPGILSYRGSIKGGWFFEGNILINILDANKQVLKASNAVATTDWMTAEPVEFEGNIDFTGLPSGPAYFEIHNDNASGLPENDKFIQIPIILQ